jgi:predicted regulator of Ras-like GTPase activity (Roadblock/LC7/MglB family)
VEPAEALADLLEISSHVEAAVLCDATGAVTASTLADEAAAAELARVAADLFAAASELRASGEAVARVEASFAGGSVFAVRDGERMVAATSVPDPPAALVLYDLRTLLKSTAPEPPKPRRRPSRAKKKPSEETDVSP